MVITLTMAIKRLLSSRNCGHCDEAKRILQNEINNGEIEVIDIDSNRDARELARLFGGVPTLLEENDGELHELLLIQQKDKTLIRLQDK